MVDIKKEFMQDSDELKKKFQEEGIKIKGDIDKSLAKDSEPIKRFK